LLIFRLPVRGSVDFRIDGEEVRAGAAGLIAPTQVGAPALNCPKHDPSAAPL
jgi:hypothetical protein